MHFDTAETDADEARLNLTPMIDVIFLLIIFFMTVARLTTIVSTAPVDLPEASEADADVTHPPGRLIVNVFGDGRIALGDEVISFGVLRARLRDRPAEAGPVLIRADRLAPLRLVKRVALACVAAGADQVAFGAQPVEPPAEEPDP